MYAHQRGWKSAECPDDAAMTSIGQDWHIIRTEKGQA
jgi:hypothetical protein